MEGLKFLPHGFMASSGHYHYYHNISHFEVMSTQVMCTECGKMDMVHSFDTHREAEALYNYIRALWLRYIGADVPQDVCTCETPHCTLRPGQRHVLNFTPK